MRKFFVEAVETVAAAAFIAVCICLLPFAVIAALFVPESVTEEEVYESASFAEWRSRKEMKREIARRQGKEGPLPSYMEFGVHLSALLDDGLLEEDDHPTETIFTGTDQEHPIKVYRKKPGGSRRPKWDLLPDTGMAFV